MPEDPEKSGNEPNLELPSLFGRGRKKKRQAEQPAPEPTQEIDAAATGTEGSTPAEEAAATGPVPVEGSTRRLPPTPPPPSRDVEETAPVQASAPTVEPPAEPAPEQATAPVVDPIPAPIPVEPTPEPLPTPEPEPMPVPPPAPDPVVEPAPEPEPEPAPEPEPVPEPAPAPAPAPVPEPAPIPEPAQVPEPAPVEQTTVLPPAPATDASAPPLFVDEVQDAQQTAVSVAEPDVEVAPPTPPRERRQMTLPRINARVAAVVSGLVVGLVGVLLAFAASQSCEAVRGVGSCGGLGLVALLGVLIIEVVLGSILLKAFGLLDPTSTSFLGVGLVAVIALLFFLSSLDSVWMLLVLPVLTGLTFLLSWWVTETFIEQNSDDLHR